MHNFLGINKSSDYKEIVAKLLKDYKQIGAHMSLKLHFLHSHLDLFPANLGVTSYEQDERLHQNLHSMEKNYQGFWDEGMMSDYCWMLCETDGQTYARQSNTGLHFQF